MGSLPLRPLGLRRQYRLALGGAGPGGWFLGAREPGAGGGGGRVGWDFAKRRNIVVGRPPIKPVETSYVPVVRQIPEAKRPPTAVRKIDVKELRQTRPLVKEPGRSALRAHAQPRPLEAKKLEKPR